MHHSFCTLNQGVPLYNLFLHLLSISCDHCFDTVASAPSHYVQSFIARSSGFHRRLLKLSIADGKRVLPRVASVSWASPSDAVASSPLVQRAIAVVAKQHVFWKEIDCSNRVARATVIRWPQSTLCRNPTPTFRERLSMGTGYGVPRIFFMSSYSWSWRNESIFTPANESRQGFQLLAVHCLLDRGSLLYEGSGRD